MTTITLYGFAVSPHVRSALIAFREKGLTVDWEQVMPDGLKTEEFGRINPFRKMPALVHGDVKLYETPSLLVYADEIGSGARLEPTDAVGRAKMWQFIGIAQNYLYPVGTMQLYFQNVLTGLFGLPKDEAVATAAVDPTRQHLDVVEAAIEGGYVVRGAFTLADIYCGTQVDYIARARDGKALVAARPKVAAWLETLRARPSFKETFPEMLVGTDQS
ncbi:MAG: glutathione S-transferase family protein [Pyrinomonadaceae bacterium]|nr:glutathione S-transferase family protein [Phycisphaerales bacterium]